MKKLSRTFLLLLLHEQTCKNYKILKEKIQSEVKLVTLTSCTTHTPSNSIFKNILSLQSAHNCLHCNLRGVSTFRHNQHSRVIEVRKCGVVWSSNPLFIWWMFEQRSCRSMVNQVGQTSKQLWLTVQVSSSALHFPPLTQANRTTRRYSSLLSIWIFSFTISASMKLPAKVLLSSNVRLSLNLCCNNIAKLKS